MSFYNLIHGRNPFTNVLLELIGNPQAERFEDISIGPKSSNPDEVDEIFVHLLTRMGGHNREKYNENITTLQSCENYVTDYDLPEDETYAEFVFRIPEDCRQIILDVQQCSNRNETLTWAEKYSTYDSIREIFNKLSFGMSNISTSSDNINNSEPIESE